MTAIHPSAVIASTAEIDPAASVGPFAVIGPQVQLGAGTVIGPHAVIEGRTRLGANNRVGSHAVLGAAAQVRRGEERGDGTLLIGDDNWIREFATVHGGHSDVTRLGDGNLLMAYSHVAHDCQLGCGVELANGVQLAGHVRVEDSVVLGGLAAVHQFVRIGACAFVGAGAMVSQDVPPYALVSGDRAQSYGVNTVGLRRIGLDGRQRSEIRLAFKLLYGAPTLEQGLARIRGELPESPQLAHLIAFCAIKGRGLCAPARARRHAR